MFFLVLGVLAALIFASWHYALALAGRSTFPARERVPLREWGIADIAHNARRGRAGVVDLDCRRCR